MPDAVELYRGFKLYIKESDSKKKTEGRKRRIDRKIEAKEKRDLKEHRKQQAFEDSLRARHEEEMGEYV